MANPHSQFVSLQDYCPGLLVEASYSTKDNFTGTVVPGYKARKAFTAIKTADALCLVQKELSKQHLALKIFDAYRPVKAVKFFQDWALMVETNPDVKAKFYPTFSRSDLFERGYIAKRSSHSRGGALDLTLTDLKSGKDLDMGGIFDFFDDVSTTETPLITPDQQKNRLLLKSYMTEAGFKNFAGEWWHYSLKSEQFPDQYFDFDVE